MVNELKQLVGYFSREPLPAKIKNKIKERVKKKYGRIVCEQDGKKPYGVTLEYHHINMKNSDNRVKNIKLLCPNHHKLKHKRVYRKKYKNIFNITTHTRLVKKSKKNYKKKKVYIHRWD